MRVFVNFIILYLCRIIDRFQSFLKNFSFLFNSRTAIAGAIIGLLLFFFYFVVMIFVMTLWRHSHFLFIRSCNFNWIACVTSFFALSRASFLFLRVIKIFGHTWLTSLSKMTSSIWNWLLFTLIERDKVKWVCVTLNEGYLRSANRGSNNIYRFLIKV